MGNLGVLFAGELQRMKKYHLFVASFLVALIWVGILYFTKVRDVSKIFPLIIFLDATSMSMLMMGVSMFFEKQEGVFKSLLVSPISKGEYLLAKSLANLVSVMMTLIILYLYAKIFKEINLNLIGLMAAVSLVALFHSLVGVLLTYYAKDFTEVLMGMMKYVFIFMIPILLEEVGLIRNEIIKKLLFAVPTKASLLLLKASAGGVKTDEMLIATIYLVVFSVALYWVTWKKFNQFVIKEGGV